MDRRLIFNFKTDLSNVEIPKELNNPFESNVPEAAQRATEELQTYIEQASEKWNYDFSSQKGKMFGVLVVQQENKSLAYLGAVSGTLASGALDNKMIPSIFNEAQNDLFISEGLTEIANLGLEIKEKKEESIILKLKAKRKALSISLQKRLFEETRFVNRLGQTKNVIEIFKDGQYGYPPSATGECAAPKLLHYAFANKLKPIALAEFWWGQTPKSMQRIHKAYYAACTDKCRPILEFILNNSNLFSDSKSIKQRP